MCPDREILSLYHDGELPSPWREKLERHLVSCPECGACLAEYRRLSSVLSGKDSPLGRSFEAALGRARDRVWENLDRGEGAGFPRREKARLWNRRVNLPLPVAAAAAAVLVAAGAAIFQSRAPRPAPVVESLAGTGGIGLEVRGITYPADPHGILQYLGDTDTPDMVIIRLPESKRFMSSGEPAIIKAADYGKPPAPGAAGAGRGGGRSSQ
jgi:hypothetical protein